MDNIVEITPKKRYRALVTVVSYATVYVDAKSQGDAHFHVALLIGNNQMPFDSGDLDINISEVNSIEGEG